MRPSLSIAIMLGLALLACAALYAWSPVLALFSLGSALAGFAAARLVRPAGASEGAERALSEARLPEATTPNVAAAVAAGEVPAAALLEVTMDSMREGVLVIDSAMRVVASNNSARDIFRSDGADSLGARRLSDLTRNPSIYSAFAAAVARGVRAEVKVETTRGTERRVYDLHVAPLRQREVVYGSDVRGAVGVFFDITRLERLERVRQEFLSNVSHELRTPLTAIITFVETLENGADEDRENSRRFLSVIRRNAERMHVLINDILELSAIEAGTVSVETRDVRLASLVGECFTALASHAAERRISLRSEVPTDVLVRADARRLEQMLTNLLDNAVKFNREGGEVVVTHERSGGRDRIIVRDTGEGIAPEHLPRIFERFYRVDRARSRALGGTGLGLAIVKHLARAHGGEATVRSAPGEGSAFTVELPARQEP
ncbi:MAG TPA: ATP-binding protein [Pyrinomonadaceae bacterium]|jgi:two-component system phosphate regulon sensor histidine kinase PhoR|nr:ATP-binding protein [Pyrinomonadaceae bacterium]